MAILRRIVLFLMVNFIVTVTFTFVAAVVFKAVPNMIHVLKKLKETADSLNREERHAFHAFKVSGRASFWGLFSSHPPIDERIKRVQALKE